MTNLEAHAIAFGIIDYERGFIDAQEGERLGLPGFGELPVPGAEKLLPNINELSVAFSGLHNALVFHTMDKHPRHTAHFSDEPNYVDTWPPHCIMGTAGAELHPELYIAQHGIGRAYFKGTEACTTPEEDDSYTGALAVNPLSDVSLPQEMKDYGVRDVYLTGVALGDGAEHKLCVDSTAVDLHNLGFNVTVITDAVEAVLPDNKDTCFKNLGAIGIHLATTQEVLDYVRA